MQHSEGWLTHTTNTCPVPANTPTIIKLRSGRIITTDKPQHWLWGYAQPITVAGNPGEIVAYRLSEQETA